MKQFNFKIKSIMHSFSTGKIVKDLENSKRNLNYNNEYFLVTYNIYRK
jgi:hypothetical protein